MLTQMLMLKVSKDESLRESLELTQDISEASETAINIVNDLLEYESLDAGMLKIEAENISPQNLIRTKTLAMIAKRNNQTLVVIPAVCPPNCFVSADVYRIDQVVRNLVTNACKFTPLGGTITVKAVVEIDATSSDILKLATDESYGFMRISVADTGVGIKHENQKQVFGQFAQFDRNQLQSGGGSGLGLWISSKIVSAHSSKLQFESAGIAGQGTTFYFDLPILKLDETGELVYNASTERDDEFPAGSHRMVGVALQSRSSKVAPAVVSISHELPIAAKLSPLIIQSSVRVTSEPLSILKGSATELNLRRQLLAPLNTYSSTNNVSSSNVGSVDEGSTFDRAFNNSDNSPPVKVFRILLVDDVAINRKMVRKMLEMEPSLRGCIIFEADDGTDAVAFVARTMVSTAVESTKIDVTRAAELGFSIPVIGSGSKVGSVAGNSKDGDVADAAIEFPQLDCIFMDSVMKLMHGPDAVMALRKDLGYQGPIIGLTGNAMPEDIKAFMRCGLDGILIKPVKRAALLGALISAGVLPRS